MKTLKQTLTALAVSGLVLGTVSTAAFITTSEAAYAKGGNGGGNDNGGNNGNGNGNGGNSNGGGHKAGGKSAATGQGGHTPNRGLIRNGKLFGLIPVRRQAAATAKPMRPTNTSTASIRKSLGTNRGALASELKGLNAAHANPNALANANPDSMVGKVAAYKMAVETDLLRASLETDLIDFNQQLDDLLADYDGRSATEVQADIDALDDTTPTFESDLAALTTELEDAKTHETDVADLSSEIGMAEDDIAALGPTPEEALDIAANGRTLSFAGLTELHRLLDLAAPEELAAPE